MNLGFSQTLNGKKTLFCEKIIKSLGIPTYKKYALLDLLNEAINPTEQEFIEGSCNPLFMDEKLSPKIHTIRHDEKKRWSKGMYIHFVINNRSPNRFQFAPVTKVQCVQRIDIKPVDGGIDIFVEGIRLCPLIARKLAKNDGFETMSDFVEYFKDGLENGSLICWTEELTYHTSPLNYKEDDSEKAVMFKK